MPTLPLLDATDRIFIAGQWRVGASRETLPLINPSDGSTLAQIACGNADDIDAAVQAAQAALDGEWGRLTAAERGRLLMRLSARVLEAADDLARLEALDVGKPLKQARNDAVAMARYFEFYGGAADKVMGETIPYASGTTALTLREPHGVTGHIVTRGRPARRRHAYSSSDRASRRWCSAWPSVIARCASGPQSMISTSGRSCRRGDARLSRAISRWRATRD